jgi:hypothetical protein
MYVHAHVYLRDSSHKVQDTHKSETDVLGEIADWLQDTYEESIQLNGIIYLHSINNVRMEGSALRNLKMFRKLCGVEPLRNVVLATTFWGKVNESTGREREQQLKERRDFWGGMIAKGSKMTRFTDRESGLRIVSGLLNKRPVPLEIQRELVDQEKGLIETAAGQTVNEELLRVEAKHAEERAKIQEEMREALHEKDEELQAILAEQEEKLDRRLDKVRRQQEQLKARTRAERREMEQEMERKMREVELSHVEDRKALKEQLNAERRAEQRELANGFDSRMRQLEGERESDREYFEEQLRLRDLSFEQAVSIVRANEGKLRDEERREMEQRIAELSTTMPMTKKKEKKTGRILMKSLSAIFPAATMALLGVPLPFPGSGAYDFVEGLFGGSGDGE